MSAKLSQVQQRHSSYGQERTFRGLEKFAIERRLSRAHKVMAMLNSGKQNAVLELGCGFFANNLKILSERYPQFAFTGVDIAVTEKPSGKIDLVAADLRTWKPKASYDAVLSLAVIEHLTEPTQHFSLISASLTSGGLAGLTTPTPEAHRVLSFFAALGIFDKAEISDHKAYLTETGLREMAAQNALEVIEYERFSLGFNQWMLLRKN
jgi:trans-aconitate methyltransferase